MVQFHLFLLLLRTPEYFCILCGCCGGCGERKGKGMREDSKLDESLALDVRRKEDGRRERRRRNETVGCCC